MRTSTIAGVVAVMAAATIIPFADAAEQTCTIQGRPSSCRVRDAPCKRAKLMGTVRTGELVKYVDSVTSADQFYFDQGAEVPCDDGTTTGWDFVKYGPGYKKTGWTDSTCVIC